MPEGYVDDETYSLIDGLVKPARDALWTAVGAVRKRQGFHVNVTAPAGTGADLLLSVGDTIRIPDELGGTVHVVVVVDVFGRVCPAHPDELVRHFELAGTDIRMVECRSSRTYFWYRVRPNQSKKGGAT